MNIAKRKYVTGRDRNEPKMVAHLYRGTFNNTGEPMCSRGWNRVDGWGYSIFRNLTNVKICKVCLRRAGDRMEPVKPKTRKTKWI